MMVYQVTEAISMLRDDLASMEADFKRRVAALYNILENLEREALRAMEVHTSEEKD